ncbi:hypothetical protein Poli38472_002750 [Pythium oligandrum]|uniref:Uncharacterized protein n=1 Tax=Pythium oligandrum TaxID=41045 RepID=A0A8K1FK44_PYTOL|nr:hypothetical protein Poli38472_002750 [Pythium oligandrum]|eukprot:TMW63809.1 hypothetical protein Poli38472_002750 [Pythium oligandrum]
MVHIINGEIVPDDDPRVKARFQNASGGADASRRRPVAGFGGGGGGGVPGAGAAAPPQPPMGAGGQSPLQGLARSAGLEGTVLIPGFLGLPAKPVEKIHLAVAALLVFFFGWRALAFIAFAYVLSLQQPPAAGGARPPPPPQNPGTGVSGVRRL